MNSLRVAFNAQTSHTPVQMQAWNAFGAIGLPGLRDEQWKYTQLHRLYSQSFDARPNNPILVVPNGVALKTVVTSGFKSKQPFELLSYALNDEELSIEVPDDVIAEQPLLIEFTSAGGSALSAPRINLKLGRNSKLTLIEQHSSSDEVPRACFAVTNISLGDNAQLEHCLLQDTNRTSFHIGSIEVVASAHARYINHHFNLGGVLGRLDLNVKLQGAEAYAELNGLQFATGNQVHDTHSRIEHCVPRALSSETYHGIADERGQVVFNGKVLVHKHAIGTDAQQSSRNLLLSPKAEIDTKPELEIYADDVKCSHGATIGQLDNNALFYLRSRGIGEQQARALLTLAFADAVIDKVPLTLLRDELIEQVHARFGNTMEAVS